MHFRNIFYFNCCMLFMLCWNCISIELSYSNNGFVLVGLVDLQSLKTWYDNHNRRLVGASYLGVVSINAMQLISLFFLCKCKTLFYYLLTLHFVHATVSSFQKKILNKIQVVINIASWVFIIVGWQCTFRFWLFYWRHTLDYFILKNFWRKRKCDVTVPPTPHSV